MSTLDEENVNNDRSMFFIISFSGLNEPFVHMMQKRLLQHV